MCTCTLLSGGLQGNRAERKLRAFAKREPSGVMATVADYPTLHQSGRGGEERRRDGQTYVTALKCYETHFYCVLKGVHGTTAPPAAARGNCRGAQRRGAHRRRDGERGRVWTGPAGLQLELGVTLLPERSGGVAGGPRGGSDAWTS